MYRNLTILISLLLILLVPGELKSSLVRPFLKFAAADHLNNESIQIPPLQSPSPSIGLDSRGGGAENSGGEKSENDEHDQVPSNSPNSPKAGLVVSITNERCSLSLSMSCQDLKNMIACLSNGGTGPEGSFLIVQNNEDTTVNVSFTILPANSTFEEIELQKHQAKKINISELIGGSQSIVLNAGNGNCKIHIASPAPEVNSGKNNEFEWGGPNVTPTHGAYVLVLMVLVGGGACACFKFRKRGRHLDGVPYQELEMGQLETASAVNVETKGGWDEVWDDDWDEEKAVKSPGGKPLRHGKVNGNGVASGSSHDDGWGNDWND